MLTATSDRYSIKAKNKVLNEILDWASSKYMLNLKSARWAYKLADLNYIQTCNKSQNSDGHLGHVSACVFKHFTLITIYYIKPQTISLHGESSYM